MIQEAKKHGWDYSYFGAPDNFECVQWPIFLLKVEYNDEIVVVPTRICKYAVRTTGSLPFFEICTFKNTLPFIYIIFKSLPTKEDIIYTK